jgi:hypothetical protein
MSRFCCSAQIVAAASAAALLAALPGALAGCGTMELFHTYDLPEDPKVAAAPWPRLIDTPAAPPVGVYTPAVPDPAAGVLAQSDLAAAGAAADARAAELAAPVAAPVVPQAEPAGAPPAAPADSGLAAAAAARAAALAGPVITDAERAAMLEAANRQPPVFE